MSFLRSFIGTVAALGFGLFTAAVSMNLWAGVAVLSAALWLFTPWVIRRERR